MNILLLEDNPLDADLIIRGVSSAIPGCQIELAPTLQRARELINAENIEYHIGLFDMRLPDGNGLDLLVEVKKSDKKMAVVMLTGTGNEDVAVAALKAGADDYVAKRDDFIDHLPQTIRYAIDSFRKNLNQASESINVLYIEDYYADVDLTLRHFQQFSPNIQIEVISDAEKALSLIGKNKSVQKYDVILMENQLPGLSALAFIKIVRQEMEVNIPIILITGYGSEDVAVQAIKLGATDYVSKNDNYLHRLPTLITNAYQFKELVKAKEKAEESDRLKTAFLHNISHEIRTPMNAIVNFSAFIKNPDLEPQKCRQYADIIIQSTNQLLSIITDIINIATIDAGLERIKNKDINLNDLLNTLHQQFLRNAQNKNISLSVDIAYSGEKANIIVDETKLSQVLSNLINNALKFTSKGTVSFGYHLKNRIVEFYVKDSGIGIADEMHEIIFGRFRQVDDTAVRRYGGSGLGLAISKAYVELMGGKIWLTSELEKGSVFYFSIPWIKPVKEKIKTTPENEVFLADFSGPKTVLVAEDEELNYLLLEEVLSEFDIKVIRAVNGADAVEICQSGNSIDLILMDLKMPVMSGFDATEIIREKMPQIPIIAQTAYSQTSDREKAITCGCDDFISKPFRRNELLRLINKYLEMELK